MLHIGSWIYMVHQVTGTTVGVTRKEYRLLNLFQLKQTKKKQTLKCLSCARFCSRYFTYLILRKVL